MIRLGAVWLAVRRLSAEKSVRTKDSNALRADASRMGHSGVLCPPWQRVGETGGISVVSSCNGKLREWWWSARTGTITPVMDSSLIDPVFEAMSPERISMTFCSGCARCRPAAPARCCPGAGNRA